MNCCALGVNYTHVIPVSQPLGKRKDGQKRVKIVGFFSFLQIYKAQKSHWTSSGAICEGLM
jgi:hypothetical protein